MNAGPRETTGPLTTSTSTGAALVEVRGVSRWFGTVAALAELDLDLEEGGFHSLLGPSGCGKTTLLRILAGFDSPDTGDVRLDGRSVLDLPPHRRPTNIVFQRYALFPHLSVADNVAFGLTTGGGRRRKARSQTARTVVADVLEMVGLAGLGDRRPAQLSGGQAQRVAVARALVARPRLLLLDEPLSALDQNVRLAMRESLLNIHREAHTTFLLVTHDQEEALSMSTSVALMNHGRIEQVGAPAALYQTPATRFAATFVGAGTMVAAGVERVSGDRAWVVAGGTEWAPTGVGVRPGADAVVFLRPEELRLVGDADARLRGEVATTVFLGSAYELGVETAVGRLRLRTGDPVRVGERVGIDWSDLAGRAFPADAPSVSPDPGGRP